MQARRVAKVLLTVTLLATVCSWAGVFSSGKPTPASAQPDPPAVQERQFLTLLNQERVNAGLAPLVRDSGLDAVAQAWSGHMASTGVLAHRTNLAEAIASVEPQWRRGGENVGVGGDVPSLHRAFMNSPGHRANVLGPYDRVGV